MNRFSPLLGNKGCYVLHGHDADPIVTVSKAEVEQRAEDLNGDRENFAVVFLFPDGTWTDVTDEFWRAPPDFVDEYAPRSRLSYMRRSGAFG
jgi:hypothetical protein